MKQLANIVCKKWLLFQIEKKEKLVVQGFGVENSKSFVPEIELHPTRLQYQLLTTLL